MSDKTKSLMDLYNEKYVSVEDGERVYTEAQVKERAWEAWSKAAFKEMNRYNRGGMYKSPNQVLAEFEEWYNEKYESDE